MGNVSLIMPRVVIKCLENVNIIFEKDNAVIPKS